MKLFPNVGESAETRLPNRPPQIQFTFEGRILVLPRADAARGFHARRRSSRPRAGAGGVREV